MTRCLNGDNRRAFAHGYCCACWARLSEGQRQTIQRATGPHAAVRASYSARDVRPWPASPAAESRLQRQEDALLRDGLRGGRR